jgi:hypothetical protein
MLNAPWLLDMVRKTPNKVLIVLFLWFTIGVGYYKFNILKSYYEFKIKEKENKRKFLFIMATKI